jgi:hypothetical protein
MPKLRAGRLVLAMAVGFCAFTGASDAQSKEAGDAFDREAAATAMKAVDVGVCKKKKGPTGDGHVIVTFVASGSVSAVAVDPPFAGTKVGTCVAKAYKTAKIPAFSGAAVNVGKKFKIE